MKLHGRHLAIPLLIASLLTSAYFLSERYRLVMESQSATLRGDPDHPATASNWVDTHLYFGLGPANAPGKGVPETAWREFLDKEVTPRFPFRPLASSTSTANGAAWKRPSQNASAPSSSSSTTRPRPRTTTRIEAIRAAWKRRTGDQSVLKVTQTASVSF